MMDRYKANNTPDEARLQAQITEELQKRRMRALFNLTKDPDFLVFWAWLQERAGIYNEVFYGNSRDMYEKGKRAVALLFFKDLLTFNEAGVEFRNEAEKQYIRDRTQILACLKDKEKEEKRK